MITTDDVADSLIGKLAEIYPKPAMAKNIAARVAAVCGEWVTVESLTTLAEQIIATRESKTFPNVPTLLMLAKAIPQSADKPGEVSKTKAKAKTERIGGLDRTFRFGQDGANEREKAFDEAEKRAYRFLRGTELAAKAVAESWAVGLVDFAIREGREPDYEEERRIIAKVRANDVDVRDFVDAPDPIPTKKNASMKMPRMSGKMGPALRAMRASMHEAAARRLTGDDRLSSHTTGTVN